MTGNGLSPICTQHNYLGRYLLNNATVTVPSEMPDIVVSINWAPFYSSPIDQDLPRLVTCSPCSSTEWACNLGWVLVYIGIR